MVEGFEGDVDLGVVEEVDGVLQKAGENAFFGVVAAGHRACGIVGICLVLRRAMKLDFTWIGPRCFGCIGSWCPSFGDHDDSGL